MDTIIATNAKPMVIIVSFMNFQNDLKDMMEEIADRISIVQPKISYRNNFIDVELQTRSNIRISFMPALSECIIGTRPNYYWTNSYDIDHYYRHYPGVKCLQNFTELTNVVLTECLNDLRTKRRKKNGNNN